MLLLASMPGRNAELARELATLGALVRFREDSVDYLRVKVPADRVADVARSSAVQIMAVDGVQMYDTSEELPVDELKRTPAPNSSTPSENPFLPTKDIGAPQFVRDHPTFDGRGVTIANVDGNSPDILAPELQMALSIDGTRVPKFADVINSLDPVDDDSSFRVDMSNEVEARNQRFEWKQTIYSSPADGIYRIGFFNVGQFGGGLLRAYLPQLKPDKNSLAILWDEQTNRVWVDTNSDNSFTDETALTDFNVSYTPGVLGRDDPGTPVRESVAFIVLTNSQHKLVYLAPLVNGHATMTASVAAGYKFFGGQMNGVAPAARLASVLRKPTTHSLIEGMILAVKNPKVDLVSLQSAALMPPQDGNSVVGVTFQRLIEKYKKPIFSSADNLGPGISTNGEPAVANDVISVGGYVNRLTWESNYGVTTTVDDTLVNLSARGPRVDGGFKPDLVAPAAVVARDFANDAPRASGWFVLPPGYSSGAGTSNSCPMVSGTAALLISAAKQSGVPYDAQRIAWALKTSARFLPGVGAHEQGNGLINVAAAWEALKQAPRLVTISSSTDVNVAVGPHLKMPYRGPGIYEREGWRAGQSGQRTIAFIRTSGSPVPIDYLVRWTGNDGTFSSPSRIQLPLNKPVSLPVTIRVATAGAHSAIINLDDARGARSVYQVMNTVIAAEQFSANNNFTVVREGSAEYPGYSSFFFNVPKNSSAFRVDVRIQKGTIRLRFMRPTGKEFDHAHDTPVRWLPEYQSGGILDRVISDPEPGVWQVIVENQSLTTPGSLDSESRRARYEITAAVFGVESQSSATELNTRIRDVANKQQVKFANYFASFAGYYAETPLGSAFTTRETISDASPPIVYEINVPEGARELRATISGPSTKDADVDLYLYSCANGCELKAFSARAGVNEKVLVTQPKAGKWKVVIDPVSIPSGTLTIDYTDIFTHPAFGSLAPLTRNATFARATNADMEVLANIDARPVGNRRLVGLIELLTLEPATVRYDYNVDTKTVEPVKEQVVLAEALLELHNRVNKQKALVGNAGH
ncbi:MAG TPA: S8 family serine peptidase [Pyrinomonadaceae bacterium]